MRSAFLRWVSILWTCAAGLVVAPQAAESPPAARALGTWAGTIEHDGETQPVALMLEAAKEGHVLVRISIPAIHVERAPVGQPLLDADPDSVRFAPFRLAWGDDGESLHGVMPASLVPVYEMPIEIHRVERFDAPPRAPLRAPERAPRWSFAAGSALWAGPVCVGRRVYVGAQDGTVYALDALTGRKRWAFRTGGPIRARPAVDRGTLYVQADDGFLYALDQGRGTLRWKAKIVEGPIERLPFDRAGSRYDRFASDVVVDSGRLFVGTHDGRMLALDSRNGHETWSFQCGDAVLAAPAIAGGLVVFGSYDHFVYALGAAEGRLVWKTDTKGAVVSTPAVLGDLAIVGNRCYDLLGIDVTSGSVAWKRYLWMSWIESSARLFDGVAYVGSSDAAVVQAIDPRDGRPIWRTDVFGWTWGQPAVTDARVYAGASSQAGYAADHRGGFFAIDRRSGAVDWHYAVAVPDSGAYGFPGSPAVGAGLVFACTLDGRVLAFEP